MTEGGEPVRAVVLDLDDTLFDTSGTLIVPANREAAAAMIAAGLPGTVDVIAQRRLQFGRAHPDQDADALTVRSTGVEDDGTIAAAGRKAFFDRTVRRIDPFPETLPVLEALQDRYDLFLLTIGNPRTQQRKIDLLKIERYFEEVLLVDIEGERKLDALEALARRRGLRPEQVAVVGDRIDREITAARLLGMWAVRMARGEGRHMQPSGPEQRAHYTIDRLDGLPYVLDDIADSGEGPGVALSNIGTV